MTEKRAKIAEKSAPSAVLKLAFLQLLATVFFSLVLYYCFDTREALSALFGGLIAALANLFFAGRLFTTKHDAQAQDILFRFYFSVAMQVIFILAMMAFCIILLLVSILPFVISILITAVRVKWVFI